MEHQRKIIGIEEIQGNSGTIRELLYGLGKSTCSRLYQGIF